MLTATLALAAAESAAAQTREGGPPILGYPVRLRTTDGGTAKGELIAVSPDSLFLLRNGSVAVLPIARLEQVDVRQSSFGPGKAMLWSLIAGAVSGALLTGACASVEGADCGGVFPGVLITWSLIGGVAALSVGAAQYDQLRWPSADELRRYSRFPQGLPDEFRRAHPSGHPSETGTSGGG
jgi:hypothetical protein